MIRSAWRRIVAFLGSARFATVLLAILGVWSMLATVIPQTAVSSGDVAKWAASHRLFEPVVAVLGLHNAFSNPIFIALAVVLGVSTALCAWQRTKVALHRAQTLRNARSLSRRALSDSHDIEIECERALEAPEMIAIASDTLDRLGVKHSRRGDILSAVSPQWTTWGSPIFHWALLGLLVALLVGNMLRSEGLMGVVVGQTKPDAPASYGVLHTGPLHSWRRVQRSIRVDDFEPNYTTGGVDRGPTPTVSLLDSAGKVVKKQRVYPNMTLKSGSLTIYPSSYGLAVLVSEVTTSGTVLGRGFQLVDFSEEASGGTTPVGGVAVLDSAGAAVYRATLTVPLDRGGAGLLTTVPREPSVRVVMTSSDGKTVIDQVIRQGQSVGAPGSVGLRLDGITYYARLQVVDDWTIPLLYAGLIVALIGLSISTLTQQQIVLVTAVEGADGAKLVAKVRLWRNASTSRDEIENELDQALNGAREGDAT